MKIGFTSTTFRPIKSLEKIVDIAKQSGADCIEWGGDIHVTDIESAQKAASLCKNAGVEISSYGSYYKVGCGDDKKWKSICRIADAMGARVIRVWLGEKGSKATDDEYYERILNDLIGICEEADKYGLTVSPECHTSTYNDNTEAFLKIYKEFCEKGKTNNFKTYFQSKYKKLDYDLRRIEKTIEHIEIVHISYSEQMREQFFFKRDGEYINKLLKKLKESGYDKTILLEYTYFSSPSFLIKDIEKLKKDLES